MPLENQCPRPDLIIFDFDGTLTDHNKALAYFAANAKMEDIAVRAIVLAHAFYSATKGINEFLFSRSSLRGLKNTFLNFAARPRDGAISTLKNLEAMGVKMALLSNGPGSEWGQVVINHLGIDKFFSLRLFREDLENQHKPSPNGIYRIIRESKESSSVNIVWVVGDTEQDMEAAFKAASMRGLNATIIPVAMGNKSGAAEYLRRQPAYQTHIFASMKSLITGIDAPHASSAWAACTPESYAV